jgi:hypothetical protein
VKTGYEISLRDFLRLCVEDPGNVAPLLRQWFSIELVLTGQSSLARLIGKPHRGFLLRDANGIEVDSLMIHDAIQSDPERQNTIYNVAMTLWR